MRLSLSIGLLLLALPIACRRTPEPTIGTVNGSEIAEPPPPTCESGNCEPCTAASECPTGICHESGRCEPQPCATDDACPTAEICDGNQCLPDQNADPAVCGVAKLWFAFDSAKLSPSNQERLAQATPCLLEQLASDEAGKLNISGNGDRLGSDDYQLALAQRRAASIRAFLLARGLPEARTHVFDEVVGDPRSALLTIEKR
jgi:peptidoglycan-associated lipoprotein